MAKSKIREILPPEKLHKLMYIELKTEREIALNTGFHYGSVSRLVKEYRTTHPDLFPEHKRAKIALEERFPIEDAASMYGKIPVSELATMFNVSEGTMNNLLSEYRKQQPELFPKKQKKTFHAHDLAFKTYRQVRNETGLSDHHIWRHRKVHGLIRRPARDFIDREQIQELVDDGQSISEIAHGYGLSYRRVLQIASEDLVVVPRTHEKRFYRRLAPEEKEYIKLGKEQGRTALDIAQELDLNPITIEKQFRVLGRKRNYVRLSLSKRIIEDEFVIEGYTVEEIAERHSKTVAEIEAHIRHYKLQQ